MVLLEKELEEIIYSAPHEELSKRGLHLKNNLLRQVSFGDYGICDLIAYERYRDPVSHVLEIDIIELKKDTVCPKAYFQSLRYAFAVDKSMKQRCFSHEVHINIILIGRQIDKDIYYLINHFNNHIDRNHYFNLAVYKYSYYIDGLKFEIQ